MSKDLKHALFSMLVGFTVIALSGWLIAGAQAIPINVIAAIAWLAWGALNYIQDERKNYE